MQTRAGPEPAAVEGWRSSGLDRLMRVLVILACCLLHTGMVYRGMGGRAELASDWPLALHDHPIQYHSMTVTPAFLRQSGTTAGYDPSFMAGYPKSILFPPSSTLGDVVAFLTGTTRVAVTYKLVVLTCAALAPWLLVAAGLLLGLERAAVAWSVALGVLYVWTDFPLNYVLFGMQPYFLAVPLGLLTAAAVARWLDRGGVGGWLLAAVLACLVELVHLTSVMVVGPAALAAYIVWLVRPTRGRRLGRSLGFWAIAPIVLAANAFWWWPGWVLASQKGDSGFAFTHSQEPVLPRLGQILGLAGPIQPEIQAVLWALGLPGLVWLCRRRPVLGAALAGYAGAGLGWGYLAGWWSGFDLLQPGRHTFALYLALCVGAGVMVAGCLGQLARWTTPRLDRWALAGLVLVGLRLFGPALAYRARADLALFQPAARATPFLSSRPTPRLKWIMHAIQTHLVPGDRLLYEESGFAVPGLRDPYDGRRYSGLLPSLTGVEVLGGPYLHVALQTNFTQFGEGRLFGMAAPWNRVHFDRYARLYRPQAILCWSPSARQLCASYPDLFEVVEDDGTLLFATIRGFAGKTVEGPASVAAAPGVLTIQRPGGELDAFSVLSYHFVPNLRADPPLRVVKVPGAEDPVPLIGVDPPRRPTRLWLDPRLWTGRRTDPSGPGEPPGAPRTSRPND